MDVKRQRASNDDNIHVVSTSYLKTIHTNHHSFDSSFSSSDSKLGIGSFVGWGLFKKAEDAKWVCDFGDAAAAAAAVQTVCLAGQSGGMLEVVVVFVGDLGFCLWYG